MLKKADIAVATSLVLALGAVGCTPAASSSSSSSSANAASSVADASSNASSSAPLEVNDRASSSGSSSAAAASVEAARAALDMTEDYRESFVHGDKPAQYQKYIVLHDTESNGDATSAVEYWDGSGNGVAAHFVVNKDGSVMQCVPLDKIAHHAGFGDTGHNEQFGIEEDGRDDMVGTVPIGDWASDYGMNAWSVGIEMVHVGDGSGYPEEQLAAIDALIAYIDAYFGTHSAIIDHKEWRTGNSDTSPEFGEYLANYKAHRTHN